MIQPHPAPGPARPPQQERSAATMNRILDAAATLLTEGGWDAFRVSEVSSRADVSVGVIYQRFGDKDGLFAAVHEAHLARFAARVTRAFDPAAWPEEKDSHSFVREAVARLGAIFEDIGVLNGVLLLNSNKVPGLGQKGAETMAAVRQQVTAMIGSRSPDMPRDDPEIAVAVCYRLAYSTFMRFATFTRYSVQAHEMSWQRLISEVAHACVLYLFSPGPAPVADSGLGSLWPSPVTSA